MLTGMHNAGGDLPSDIQQRVQEILSAFESKVFERLPSSGLSPGMVPAMQICNIVAILDPNMLHVVFTSFGAGGISVIRYLDHRAHGQLPPGAGAHIAERDLGFKYTVTMGIDASILSCDAVATEAKMDEMAVGYLEHVKQSIEEALKMVRLQPIFQARDLPLDEHLVFVLSPFREPFNTIYKDHIALAVGKIHDMKCKRADDIYDNKPIMEDIWRSICTARIVIADLTSRNPNVFYETGIAHTVGKEVILIAQTIDDVPFDLRHLRCIIYEYTPRGAAALEANLHNTMATILASRPTAKVGSSPLNSGP